MLLIRGHGGGTALTGTLYERGETPPEFKGAPDEGAPYVWVCDEFYEVDSGGQVDQEGGVVQRVQGRTQELAGPLRRVVAPGDQQATEWLREAKPRGQLPDPVGRRCGCREPASGQRRDGAHGPTGGRSSEGCLTPPRRG